MKGRRPNHRYRRRTKDNLTTSVHPGISSPRRAVAPGEAASCNDKGPRRTAGKREGGIRWRPRNTLARCTKPIYATISIISLYSTDICRRRPTPPKQPNMKQPYFTPCFSHAYNKKRNIAGKRWHHVWFGAIRCLGPVISAKICHSRASWMTRRLKRSKPSRSDAFS